MNYKLIFCSIIFTIGLFYACSPSKTAEKTKNDVKSSDIIVGFSQIGAESAWRTCNTQSMISSAESFGIQLIFNNAEQKQENQIKAIRSFIAYQVDVIAFVPIVQTGWDNVLIEARDAGIPVLVTDRKITTSDESLYAGFIGTDSEQEGRDAGTFLKNKFAHTSEVLHIIEMRGTDGSSVAEGRSRGFREQIESEKKFKIIASGSGDFLRSRGKELMDILLETHKKIDIIYSHNDGMTLGILEILEQRGIKAGTDIIIVTIDAEQAAISALQEGKVNCVVECNPLFGPRVMELVIDLVNGKSIPKKNHVNGTVFIEGGDFSKIPLRGY